ncbi:MAG: ATP-binding protein [Rhodoferax sp.]|nr:ATP-binding protein [Rhodoferax sp.]
MPSTTITVALVGAECSGKSTLADALTQALRALGHDAVLVPEYLREFCERHGRTPTQQEQCAIGAEQSLRIAEAAARHGTVVADTTALMTAAYSNVVFGDDSLDAPALAAHRHCDLTLLLGLDLPWQADRMQRDGAHMRAPVDAWLRQALDVAGLPFSVVCGDAASRLHSALAAVRVVRARPATARSASSWRWHCRHCDAEF